MHMFKPRYPTVWIYFCCRKSPFLVIMCKSAVSIHKTMIFPWYSVCDSVVKIVFAGTLPPSGVSLTWGSRWYSQSANSTKPIYIEYFNNFDELALILSGKMAEDSASGKSRKLSIIRPGATSVIPIDAFLIIWILRCETAFLSICYVLYMFWNMRWLKKVPEI